MRCARWRHLIPVLLVGELLAGCSGSARRLDIDPQAEAALRKMSATVGGANSFSFRSVTTMDEPVAPGQMAQFTRKNRIVVCRPDHLLAEAHQDDDAMFLWFGARTLTVFDKASNTCATLKVPGRIDEMLDAVAGKHGLTVPLADLLFSDPYQALTAHAHMGRYIGLAEMDGIRCHHLLFTQEAIDWQIWIDAGKDAVPRKIVIDYKNMPERPQFTAVMSEWRLSAEPGPEQFKPNVPKNVRTVTIAELLAAGRGE